MRSTVPHTAETRANSPENWAEQGLAGDWRYKFFYWLMRIGGKARGYHIALLTSLWYVLFYPSIRQRCRHYLSRRFPDRVGVLAKFSDTFRLVRTYAKTLIDIMVLPLFGSNAIVATCPDHDRLIELCSAPHGFVLLQAHVGCWQVGISTLTQFPKSVSIVMIPEHRTPALFGPLHVSAIDPRTGLEGVMQMTDALLRGEIVTMMGDRTFGGDETSVTVQFLGSPALFPVIPYRLASATGSPVLVMFAPRLPPNRYELRLAEIIEVPPNLGRNPADYAPYAQRFADCLEKFAHEFPWQVFNFYDLWQKPTDDPAAEKL
jgi:predicted LPLAT superfamily acyltransferase